MKVDMVMPQMGESIAEGTISKWLKRPGDEVKKDEIILEISTDKVDSEIPSPASGILVEVLHEEGSVVPVKSKIAIIDTNGKASSADEKKAKEVKTEERAENGKPSGASSDGSEDNGRSRFYSPLVRNLAEKHGVGHEGLKSLKDSGQGGRINKEDLLKYVEARKSGGTAPSPSSTPKKETVAEAKVSSPQSDPSSVSARASGTADGEVQVVPMDNMRQAIAEHMVRSKHTSPHVYSVQEVDVSAISSWRKANKAKFEASEGFNLSFTPFFLEAAVKALVAFPYVNSSIDGKKILLKEHVNLGCAVALGNTGLIVPVIKKAEEKNFVGLARSLNDLAARARNKRLSPDDVSGGTFTVTNPGVFGTVIGTPIINQPQVAILCLGAIKKRPVVINDMIGIREMCYLTLSYDHRIVDGSLAGQFLAFICQYLENWDMKREIN